MATDSRGVLRGRCLVPQCNCVNYTRLDSDKCSGCSHRPTKHTKLDPNSVSPMPGLSVGYSAAYPPAQAHQNISFSAPAPAPRYVPPVETYSANSAPFLKDCLAQGCHNKVHYDPELGPFDYCSPQCRDQHLLPQEQAQLRREIARNTENMVTYLSAPSPSSTFSEGPERSSNAGSASSDDSPPVDGRKKKMYIIEKKPKEPLGIITAQLPDDTGFLIVGVELDTSGHRELKDGNIKLMDLITQLNEDKIRSREWFEQSTRDKTRPQLTLLRSIKSPVIRSFLTKVRDKCRLATHIRLILNPFQFHIGSDFGFEPVKTTDMRGATTAILTGVRDAANSSAHLSGVTIRDEILMYSTMSAVTKILSDPKFPTSPDAVKTDIKAALGAGKHLILVLRRHQIQY